VFPATDDPALPGLARALDPCDLAGVLTGMAVPSNPEAVGATIRSHDPLRRAVVDVRTPAGRHTLEVVSPTRASNARARHRLLAGRVAVPEVVGCTDDGILAFRPIPGDSLRTTLLEGRLVPPLRSIEALLDRMPRRLVHQSGEVGTLERLGGHVEVLSAVLPDRARRVQDLAAALAPFADRDPGPLVAHHGDLRPSILMVRMGQLVGLTDTVGVGEGYRVDDLASLIGRLSLLGWLHRSSRCEHLATCWLDEIERGGDHLPSALRARVAAVILGSAVGCFRRQDTDWRTGARYRINLAERWLDHAQDAARAERGFVAVRPERTLLTTRPERRFD
jgi:hypothetical protein